MDCSLTSFLFLYNGHLLYRYPLMFALAFDQFLLLAKFDKMFVTSGYILVTPMYEYF